MSKLAVLGKASFIGVFSLIGADTFLVEDKEVIDEVLKTIYKDGYAVLIIPEEYLEIIERLKKDFVQRDFPIILPLPDEHGSLGISRKRLSNFIKKATGAEVV